MENLVDHITYPSDLLMIINPILKLKDDEKKSERMKVLFETIKLSTVNDFIKNKIENYTTLAEYCLENRKEFTRLVTKLDFIVNKM